MSRLFAIGDIHGHKKTLVALVKKMGVKPGDTVVFLGDYIDRGPDPKGVIDYIISLQKCDVNTICLMGNHESMWLDMLRSVHKKNIMDDSHEGVTYLQAGDCFDHPSNGGYATMRQYTRNVIFEFNERVVIDEELDIPEEHIEFLRNMKPYYVFHGEDRDILFLHAGLSRRALRKRSLDSAIKCSVEKTVLSRRSPFLFERTTLHKQPNFKALLVHGHTPIPSVFDKYWQLIHKKPDIEEFCYDVLSTYSNPREVRGKLNLDTGIRHSKGRKLCAAEFVDGVHVENFIHENVDVDE